MYRMNQLKDVIQVFILNLRCFFRWGKKLFTGIVGRQKFSPIFFLSLLQVKFGWKKYVIRVKNSAQENVQSPLTGNFGTRRNVRAPITGNIGTKKRPGSVNW